MKFQVKKTPYKPIALALSLCAILIWTILGTGTSLAWFTDVSSELTNIFHAAKFNFSLAYQLSDGRWEQVDNQTKIFEDEAIFEPGYVQMAYLKVTNPGTVPFKLSTAVNVNGCVVATNVFGQPFMLHDYLKFGAVVVSTEEEMKAVLSDRETAIAIANMPLHHYAAETAIWLPGETKYIALVVRMPEEVGNIANYRGDVVPKVELGITIKVDQVSN